MAKTKLRKVGEYMDEKNNKATVYSVTQKVLFKLEQSLETSHGKAMLAKLRHSVGKSIGESVEIWPLLFSEFPETFLSKDGQATKEELAIITALQFYALHQQGKSGSVNFKASHAYENLGRSLSALRTNEDNTAVDRRFNVLITSTTIEEFIYHLRQMITLLKSKAKTTKIDYAKLAEDIFYFQLGYAENVRLRWGQEYYRYKGEENHEQ